MQDHVAVDQGLKNRSQRTRFPADPQNYFVLFGRTENLILLSVLEGPHEPRKQINSRLYPIYTQLLAGLRGFDFSSRLHGELHFRFRLYCLTGDTPAIRKMAGFLSHSAAFGCSMCFVRFPSRVPDGGAESHMDYSNGYHLADYDMRTRNDYDDAASAVLEATSEHAQDKAEKENRQRFSVLSRLPEFDIVKYVN